MGITAIAFDFGTKSIGCAVGQSITGTAQALPAFKAQDGIPNWDAIEKCLKDWKPDVIVVGLPLNMDGTEQDLTLRAKKFANRLNGRFGIKVELQDERLTTVSARDEIFQRGGYRALNKGKVDGISACLILESWFENYSEQAKYKPHFEVRFVVLIGLFFYPNQTRHSSCFAISTIGKEALFFIKCAMLPTVNLGNT